MTIEEAIRIFRPFTNIQKTVIYIIIGKALEDAGADDELVHDDLAAGITVGKVFGPLFTGTMKTIREVFDSFTDTQKMAAYVLVGQALEDASSR